MKLFLLITLLFSCSLSCKNQNSNKSVEIIQGEETDNDFESFYKKFYSDTAFQKTRIVLPLAGEILEWEEDSVIKDDWTSRKIYVTSYDTILKYQQNARLILEKTNGICVEKIFIENSGFQMERKFVLNGSKWFLMEYKISNL
jgi:hypothetical protein